MRAILLMLLIAVLDALGAPSARAVESQAINVFEPDRKLDLRALVGTDSDARSLRLSSPVPRQVRIEVSDLTDATTHARIDRERVHLTKGITPIGETETIGTIPQDFRVVVAATTEPGSFAGELWVRSVDGDPPAAVKIPLTLQIRRSPSTVVTAMPAKIDLELVRGNNWMRALAGRSGRVESYVVEFRGVEPPLAVESVEFGTLRGKTTFSEFPSGGDGQTKGLEARKDGARVLLAVLAKHAHPDRYSGDLTVRFVGLDRPVVVPVDVAVRAQPLWVLLTIVFGVIVGRLAKWAGDRGARLRTAMNALEGLAIRVQGYPATDQRLFDATIGRLQDFMTNREFDAFDTELTAAKARAGLLERVNQLLAAGQNAAVLQPLKERIGTDSAAQLAALQTEIEAATAAQPRTRSALDAPVAAPPTPNSDLARLAAAGQARHLWLRIRDWIAVRIGLPMLGHLLVIILAFLGFQTLYSSSPTFGADGVRDWLNALVWGLSADVAGRTIANLPKV